MNLLISLLMSLMILTGSFPAKTEKEELKATLPLPCPTFMVIGSFYDTPENTANDFYSREEYSLTDGTIFAVAVNYKILYVLQPNGDIKEYTKDEAEKGEAIICQAGEALLKARKTI